MLKKIKDQKLVKGIQSVIKNIEQINTLKDVKGILKLKGYKNLYRIRTPSLGKYRIVFSYKHRKKVKKNC